MKKQSKIYFFINICLVSFLLLSISLSASGSNLNQVNYSTLNNLKTTTLGNLDTAIDAQKIESINFLEFDLEEEDEDDNDDKGVEHFLNESKYNDFVNYQNKNILSGKHYYQSFLYFQKVSLYILYKNAKIFNS